MLGRCPFYRAVSPHTQSCGLIRRRLILAYRACALSLRLFRPRDFPAYTVIVTLLVLNCFCSALKAQSDPQDLLSFDYLLVASATDSDFDIWNRTLRNTALAIPETRTVYKGQPFNVVLIFQGYGLEEGGRADVVYSMRVLDPEGEEALADDGLIGIQTDGLEPNTMAMSATLITLMFEPSDVFGIYTIETFAHDRISGKRKKRQTQVELVPFGAAQPLNSSGDYRIWLISYYLNPDPARALLAYLQFAELENPVTGQLDFSQIAFFKLLFEQHPFLARALADSYPGADEETKLKVLFMLAMIDYRDADYLDELPEPEKAFFESVRLLYPPDGYDDLISPHQLDVLWAEFYATGRYAPVRQIAEGLSLSENEGTLAEFGKNANEEQAMHLSALHEVLLQSVRWSMLNNIRQHPLVRSYVLFLLEEGQLDDRSREELMNLLRTAQSTPSRTGNKIGVPSVGIPNPFRVPTQR